MGFGSQKAAAVNLLVISLTPKRDTRSKQTAATAAVQITSNTPTLMLALKLGEEKWKLGFSSAFGEDPLVRNMASRHTKSLLAHISWAKKKLGLPANARVVSCYEADGNPFCSRRGVPRSERCMASCASLRAEPTPLHHARSGWRVQAACRAA
jgi:hypothetical protein